MTLKRVIPFFLFSVLLFSCNTAKDPLENFKQVDALLSKLTEKPQVFNVPAKDTIITGEKGTVIHFDPENLETMDGQPVKDSVQIELQEMTAFDELIANNVQTVSNGKLLVTGGAYYLNMTSKGKQLKIKQDKGLDVEFLRLSSQKMELFTGKRDSVGNMNWMPANEEFKKKKIANAKKPKKPVPQPVLQYNSAVISSGGISTTVIGSPKEVDQLALSDEVSKQYQKELAQYKQKQKEIERRRKTYEAINILNFGWINCDLFYDIENPNKTIELFPQDEWLAAARFYAVFKDIRSLLSKEYYSGETGAIAFKNFPSDSEIRIIGLTYQADSAYLFEEKVNTSSSKKIKVKFKSTTADEIKDKLREIG